MSLRASLVAVLLAIALAVGWLLFGNPFHAATDSVDAGGLDESIAELVVSQCELDPGDRAILDATVNARLDAYGYRRRVDCEPVTPEEEDAVESADAEVEKQIEAAEFEAEIRRDVKAEVEAAVAAEKAAEEAAAAADAAD